MGKARVWQWTFARIQCVPIIAFAETREGGKRQAADAAGVSVRTIENWLNHPDFAQAIEVTGAEFRKRLVENSAEESLARVECQIAALDSLFKGLRTIAEARGGRLSSDGPGGESGLLLPGGSGVLDRALVTSVRDVVLAANKIVAGNQGQGEAERFIFEENETGSDE